MSKRIVILGPKDCRWPESGMINTTSKSEKTIWRQLSPFYLGPVKLYNDYTSSNMENAWQYSKVYSEHIVEADPEPEIKKSWLKWAKGGWANSKAVRYPMGKGARPEFSFWDGQRLDYREARAKIYIPLYAQLVRKTEAFAELKERYSDKETIILWDFDGYRYNDFGMSLLDVLSSPTRKMGHAFVLAMMLEWGDKFYEA